MIDSVRKALSSAALNAEVHAEPDGACRVVATCAPDEAHHVIAEIRTALDDEFTLSNAWIQGDGRGGKRVEMVARAMVASGAAMASTMPPDGPADER